MLSIVSFSHQFRPARTEILSSDRSPRHTDRSILCPAPFGSRRVIMKSTRLVAMRKGPMTEVCELREVVLDPLSLGENEVLLENYAAGIAYPYLLEIEDKHINKREYPFVVGRECSGKVIGVGKNVESLKIGDSVFGAAKEGAVGSRVVVDSASCYRFDPTRFDPVVAAGFELNYGTCWHALVDVASVKAGDVVAILGASGGVGLAAVDICVALGCVVVACASSDAKLEVCRKAGAHHLVRYDASDPSGFRAKLKSSAGKSGLNVVLDPVGGPLTEASFRELGWGGRLVVVGFASGGDDPKSAIPKLQTNLALINERKLLGVFWGPWARREPEKNRSNTEIMVRMVENGALKPFVTKTYEMNDFPRAFRDMMGGRVVGKACFAPLESSSKSSSL